MTKKEASEAMTSLGEAIKGLPAESRAAAFAAHGAASRFIGELRQERSSLKTSLAAAESGAATLAERCRDLERQLEAAKTQAQSAEQKLQTAAFSAKREAFAQSPQGHLENLVPGTKQPPSSDAEQADRRRQLLRLVPHYLPDLAKSLLNPMDVLTLHQDAFAAGYHADEYTLLGMAIKFAGESGINVMICGTSGETCRSKDSV